MSTKAKGWKRQKPKNSPQSNCIPLNASGNDCGHRTAFGTRSYSRPEFDAYYSRGTPPMSPSSCAYRPRTANSRLPVYTANGTPHGYTPPYVYNSVHNYAPFGYGSSQRYQPSYGVRRESANLVPYDVRLQHAVHQCHLPQSPLYYHYRSAPGSSRTTPSNSMPGTPHESSRSKDKFMKSSCSTPSRLSRPPTISRQPSTSSASMIRGRKFDSYMPLCEVQKALKKGEVVEGVLRINPRNYEDAYISAPDGEMDIYIGGISDRNRALNGDKVAVCIKPSNEWKILYDNIRLHWNKWSDDLLKCVNNSNDLTNHSNSKINTVTFHNSTLASIPENSSPKLQHSSIVQHEMSIKSVSANTSQDCTFHTCNSMQLNGTFVDSVQVTTAVPTTTGSALGDPLPKKKKNRSRKRREKKRKQEAANNGISFVEAQCYTGNAEPNSSDDNHLNSDPICDDEDNNNLPVLKVLNFSDIQQQLVGHQKEYGYVARIEDNLVADKDGSVTVMAHEILSTPQALVQISEAFESNSDSKVNNTDDSKFVTLEELNDDDDNWLDVEGSDEGGVSDIELETAQAMEDIAFAEHGANLLNNNSLVSLTDVVTESSNTVNLNVPITNDTTETKSLDEMISNLNSFTPLRHQNTTKAKGKTETNDKSLDEMINNLNSMTIVRKADDEKKRKRNGKKKTRNSIDTHHSKKKVNVETKKWLKDKLIAMGLPESLLSLKIENLLSLPFWKQCVQRTGKVVNVIEKNHPRVAGGKLKLTADRNPLFALFSPFDSRVPRMMIEMSECPKDLFQHPEHYGASLFMAKIDEWSENSVFPKGSLVKHLGDIGDIDAETKMILLENDIDDSEYDDRIYRDFPQLDENHEFHIPEKEWITRRSFICDCVFTIDPSTARDLDDALSINVLDEKTKDGRQLFEVGVHIADVTYFLQCGIPCDSIARMRTTSVYLVQKVIPMLPRLLCEKLCSLNPGETKLTFSVVWKMDIDGNVYEEWFGRSIIKSCVKLSYELAQDMIDKPNTQWSAESMPTVYGDWTIANISSRVNHLNAVAKNLRSKRFERGALNIDKLKLSFVLDPEGGLPIGFQTESRKESNFLVEEFMLLANMAVARKIYSHFPQLAFLRRHPPPDAKLLKEFEEFCRNADLDVDVSSEESFKASVTKLIGRDSSLSKVLSHYFLRSLTMAIYFCTGTSSSEENFSHYALNVPLYTHFTSPIRRYADVIVHRLLAASLGYNQKITEDARDLHRLAKRCNDKKMSATLASEASAKLFVNLYLRSAGPLIETGVIMQVHDHAMDVMITRFGQLARIYVDAITELESFQYRGNGEKHELVLRWKEGDDRPANCVQVIRPFSTVLVRIVVNESDFTKWNVSLLFSK